MLLLLTCSVGIAAPLTNGEEREFEQRYQMEKLQEAIERGEISKSIDIPLFLLLQKMDQDEFDREIREEQRRQALEEKMRESEYRRQQMEDKIDESLYEMRKMRRGMQ